MTKPNAPVWTSPLVKRGTLVREMGECTPFVFMGRLYRLENWQKYLEVPGSSPGDRFMKDEVRIRDVATDRIIGTPFVGHSFGNAFVWDGKVYVYALKHKPGQWRVFTDIDLVTSADLTTWSTPETVIRGEGAEHLFNVSVCRGPDRFILLYETDDKRWPAFTFKYCESQDLRSWKLIPEAIYGRDKYVGGPCLLFEGGWYYTLYLQAQGNNNWETWVTRSKDLIHWDDAPAGRPFLTFDSSRVFTYEHFGKKVEVRESNASDPELCYWNGKTLVYFNGGDQQTCGDLQVAEFAGTPRELLEAFYAELAAQTVPSPRQLAFQERQFGAFVHFGMATWYDGPAAAVVPESLREPYAFNLDQWGSMTAQPPAATFNPAELDARQWVATAKAMGARHVVLTAKHHNGFCLWPTKTTDYCVRNSPWREGKGDVLREFAEAARAAGLGVGFYISAGDVNQGCFSTPEPQRQRRLVGDPERYLPVFEAQFREILSGYGELCEIWLDGALDPFSPDVLRPDGQPVGTGCWDRLIAMARQLQPHAVIMGGTQPDIRWAGNEEGLAPYPLWNELKPGEEAANYLPPGVVGRLVPEADVFTRPSWFWTPGSDGEIASLERLMDIYRRSIGHGANLLVNLTPDRRGLMAEAEVARMTEFGAEIRCRYGQPLATVASEGCWREGMTLELAWAQPAAVAAVEMEEDLRFGQRVAKYQIEAEVGGVWQTVATGQTIGRRRLELLDMIETRRLRLHIFETAPLPKLRRFAAFARP